MTGFLCDSRASCLLWLRAVDSADRRQLVCVYAVYSLYRIVSITFVYVGMY